MQTYLAKPVFTDGFGSEESGFLQEDLVSGMWNEPYLLNTVDGRNSAPVGRWFIHVYPTTISLIIYSVS